MSHLYGWRFTLMSVVLNRMLVLEPPRASRQSSGDLGVAIRVCQRIKCRLDYTLRSLGYNEPHGGCALRSEQCNLSP